MTRLLPLLLICAACSAPQEWVRVYEGYLPGTAWQEHSVFLLRDGATGKPLPDVAIRQHVENEVSREGKWAELVGEIRTDEYGLAWIRVPGDAGSFNWAIAAAGFAPEREFGARCNVELDLQRGGWFRGRIVGPTGAPLAGVEVGHKPGCPHAAFLRRTTTDENGVFSFDGILDADFPYAHPAIAADYADANSLGGLPPVDTYAQPGGAIVGRVLGPDGEPPSWGVMQSHTGPCTVLARLSRDGSFRLRGADLGMPLSVVLEGHDSQLDREMFRPEGPFTWRVDAPEENADHEVTVDIPGRDPKWPLHVTLERTTDGLRPADGPQGEPIPVPKGEYRALFGTPFSRFYGVSEPFPVPGTERVTVRLRVHARVVIEWGQPELEPGWVQINLADRSHGIELPVAVDSNETLHLPPDMPAVLVVDREGVRRFFPIPPAKDGVRIVVVRMPEIKTLAIPDIGSHNVFIHAAIPAHHELDRGDGVLRTRVTGRVAVQLELDDEMRLHWFDLPDRDPGNPIEPIRVERYPMPAPSELQVTFADGSAAIATDVRIWKESVVPIWREAAILSHETDEEGCVESEWFCDGTPVRVFLQNSDYVPKLVTLNGDGPYRVRWGGSSLHVSFAGDPKGAAVYLDGQMVGKVKNGLCRLRGLDPGPHTLIVGAQGRVHKVMRVVLKRDETRMITLDLPLRTNE